MSLTNGTPVERYNDVDVKREDLCTTGTRGPPFSKMRGVIEHVAARPESVIGVLDTYHSQGGHAVAYACHVLGKQCVNFWPKRLREPDGLRPQQKAAQALGASMHCLPAGRSAVLYHRAKAALLMWQDSYMMPNALKLPEMVTATAAEVGRTREIWDAHRVVVSISSGTIAAGVIAGLTIAGWTGEVVLHMGYTRSQIAVWRYLHRMIPIAHPSYRHGELDIRLVDEGYAYGDAVDIVTPFPCNKYYDAKAWRWLMANPAPNTLLWSIGA